MKLLKVTTFYESYLRHFYRMHPGLAGKCFTAQKTAFDYDAFGLAEYWSHALSPLGYSVMEVTMNALPMQRAWARENSVSDPEKADLKEILLAQVKQFKPEVLWFDDYDADLLKKIRSEVSSIRLVLGMSGSAVIKTDIWRQVDLILSCAPESVEYFQRLGLNAVHLNHAFDPRINSRLADRARQIDFTFIGQIDGGKDFHRMRERLLEDLAAQTGIAIYSPIVNFTWKDDVKDILRLRLYDGLSLLKKAGMPEPMLNAFPVIGKISQLKVRPVRPVNPRLKQFVKPAVFGLEMFQVLRDSKIALNIHADSSSRHASNMRLFEITGVGSCMITDWKTNLHQLFEPDSEVVCYKNAAECVEKVTWLMNHPRERQAIADAGQARTLKEHTFAQRALHLDEIIRSKLKA